MARRVELYRDAAGGYRWRVVAGNGNVLATSGEGYVNRDHAEEMASTLFDGQYAIISDGLDEVAEGEWPVGDHAVWSGDKEGAEKIVAWLHRHNVEAQTVAHEDLFGVGGHGVDLYVRGVGEDGAHSDMRILPGQPIQLESVTVARVLPGPWGSAA